LTRTLSFDGRRDFTLVDRARFRRPRSLSILVQSDHVIAPDGGRGYRLVPGTPSLHALFDSSWPPPAVLPRVVVAQGRPGSVERGEEEARGTTLRVDLAPATSVDATWRLRLHEAEASSHPANQAGAREAPVPDGISLREELP
jgi:hypothetical protein